MPDINTENRLVNSPDLNTKRNSPELFRDMFLAKTAAEDKPAPDDSAPGVSLAPTSDRTSAAKPAEAQAPEKCSPILSSAKTAAEDDSARCATSGKDILPPDFPYADIINLPRPEPKKHKRMTRQDRAAQFAPFAALTGLDEIMEEKEQEALDFNK